MIDRFRHALPNPPAPGAFHVSLKGRGTTKTVDRAFEPANEATMADFTKVAAHFPAIKDYPVQEIFGFRGDVLAYFPNISKPSFTTDAQGFRHSVLNGKALSAVESMKHDRYGIVLGASNMLGIGLAGNGETLPSVLGERFGFPFVNASIPGGNSRNLNALLLGMIAGAPTPPAVVVLSNGGDIANFCEAGTADPIFGSPNHMQLKAMKNRARPGDPDQQFERLGVFSGLWASAMATLCRMHQAPLVMIQSSTSFQKAALTEVERDCALGTPLRPGQERLYARYRKFYGDFRAKRSEIANRLGIPLAGEDVTDRLTFIDEFHLDAQGTRILAEAVGDTIEPLLAGARVAKPAKAKTKA